MKTAELTTGCCYLSHTKARSTKWWWWWWCSTQTV